MGALRRPPELDPHTYRQYLKESWPGVSPKAASNGNLYQPRPDLRYRPRTRGGDDGPSHRVRQIIMTAWPVVDRVPPAPRRPALEPAELGNEPRGVEDLSPPRVDHRQQGIGNKGARPVIVDDAEAENLDVRAPLNEHPVELAREATTTRRRCPGVAYEPVDSRYSRRGLALRTFLSALQA